MDCLFEAKALFEEEYVIYYIFRAEDKKYRAELLKNEERPTSAPESIVLFKKDGEWQSEDNKHKELVSTLGIEIDVFNNGYGALLGRIGNQ